MEDTRNAPTADSMTADAQQITQAQDIQQTRQGKKRKSTTSAAVKRRYNNSVYDNLQINIAKGGKDAIKAAAAAAGLSTAAYITAAVNAYAGREIIPPLATNPYI